MALLKTGQSEGVRGKPKEGKGDQIHGDEKAKALGSEHTIEYTDGMF